MTDDEDEEARRRDLVLQVVIGIGLAMVGASVIGMVYLVTR